MARKRHPKTGSQTRFNPPTYFNRVRDAFAVASDFSEQVFEPVSRSLPSLPTFESASVWSDASGVEDRRQYHPAGQYRPASSPRKAVAPTSIAKRSAMSVGHPYRVFNAPSHVAICVRRKVRDEVLHALGKTGRGSGRPRRRTQWSNVKC